MKDRTWRRIGESIATTLLFLLQHIPVGGFYGLMCFPILFFLLSLGHPIIVGTTISKLFFSEKLMLGRVIAVIGLAIFLMTGIQFLRKHGELIETRFYAVVRHPQYLGIIIMTLGITIMCLQYNKKLASVGAWVIEVIGYILLARYEEGHLLKEYGEKYRQYMQRVPFIIPAPRPPLPRAKT